jgi:hypothetical protein
MRAGAGGPSSQPSPAPRYAGPRAHEPADRPSEPTFFVMTRQDDVARFLPEDPDALLVAAVMCPYCLRRPDHVLINEGDEGADAMCACATCQLQWSVALRPDQAMRFFLAPPPSLWIQHRFSDRK